MTKKYRIKNEAVEKAVRGLFKTQEDFESQLSFAVDDQKFDRFGFVVIQIAASQSVTKRACAVEIRKSDIEVLEYDPKVWNCLALVSLQRSMSHTGLFMKIAAIWVGGMDIVLNSRRLQLKK